VLSQVLALLACAACSSEPGTPAEALQPGAPASNDALYARARTALADAGIETLRWGLIPYVAPEEIRARYSPIIQRVSARMGHPMEIVVGDDYRDLESRIVAGNVDVAVLGPYAYTRAHKEQPGLQVFASHVALGSTTYGSYILTHEDSGLESLDDLKGRSFGFVDRRSTSGWLSPAARMLAGGINPQSDVIPRYLGTHEKVFDAVAAREVDAGAVYSASLAEARARNPAARQVVVLSKCERIPYDAYVARAGLGEVVGQALAAALGEISTRDAAGRKTLSSLARINGFVPVDDSHYDTIRRLEAQVLEALGPEAFAPAPEPAPDPGPEVQQHTASPSNTQQ
jgi:phosphonate transport system substrate-binding protein